MEKWERQVADAGRGIVVGGAIAMAALENSAQRHRERQQYLAPFANATAIFGTPAERQGDVQSRLFDLQGKAASGFLWGALDAYLLRRIELGVERGDYQVSWFGLDRGVYDLWNHFQQQIAPAIRQAVLSGWTTEELAALDAIVLAEFSRCGPAFTEQLATGVERAIANKASALADQLNKSQASRDLENAKRGVERAVDQRFEEWKRGPGNASVAKRNALLAFSGLAVAVGVIGWAIYRMASLGTCMGFSVIMGSVIAMVVISNFYMSWRQRCAEQLFDENQRKVAEEQRSLEASIKRVEERIGREAASAQETVATYRKKIVWQAELQEDERNARRSAWATIATNTAKRYRLASDACQMALAANTLFAKHDLRQDVMLLPFADAFTFLGRSLPDVASAAGTADERFGI